MTEVISTAPLPASANPDASMNRTLNYAIAAVVLLGALTILLGIMIF